MISIIKSKVEKCSTFVSLLKEWRKVSVSLIYACLVLDNILLTMVVPILPDYVNQLESGVLLSKADCATNFTIEKSSSDVLLMRDLRKENESQAWYTSDRDLFAYGSKLASLRNISLQILSTFDRDTRTHSNNSPEDGHRLNTRDENAEIGFLFASKAITQLLFNAFVGKVIGRLGYCVPQMIGASILLVSSLIYAFGETFLFLFVARSVHGIASAFIAVSGMGFIADMYPNEDERCRVMGFTLGGIAAGVLVGYPFGGLMYGFFNKTVPFVTLSGLITLLMVTQMVVFRTKNIGGCNVPEVSFGSLFTDKDVLLAIGAICVSTCVMAILEPCLPSWLIHRLNPPKWQLGLVFIPDSLGYLLGTNFCGSIANIAACNKRWMVTVSCLAMIAVCATLIPLSKRISHLILPHFGIGLGIGLIDATTMPHLAYLVDTRFNASYGTVYAFAQTAVCIAYAFGPLFGGELMEIFGFAILIRGIAFVNITYSILYYFLRNERCEQHYTVFHS